jgi:hypothetical protein
MGRGALLGPEESGPAHRTCVLGVWDCFFWVTVQPVKRLDGWLGPASVQTVDGLLDGVGCFPLMVGLSSSVRFELVFLPVF